MCDHCQNAQSYQDRWGRGYTAIKHDSGFFSIVTGGRFFSFPIDNEYLEMMGVNDLFSLYVRRVRLAVAE